jgi:hypothetical protein
MKTRTFKELCALTLVGDGVLTAINPRRHLGLTRWRFGPKACARTMDALGDRPRLARTLGLAAVGAGIWWASRQKPGREGFWRHTA